MRRRQAFAQKAQEEFLKKNPPPPTKGLGSYICECGKNFKFLMHLGSHRRACRVHAAATEN